MYMYVNLVPQRPAAVCRHGKRRQLSSAPSAELVVADHPPAVASSNTAGWSSLMCATGPAAHPPRAAELIAAHDVM